MQKAEWNLMVDVSMLLFKKLMLILRLFKDILLVKNAYYISVGIILCWQVALKLFKKNKLFFNATYNFIAFRVFSM